MSRHTFNAYVSQINEFVDRFIASKKRKYDFYDVGTALGGLWFNIQLSAGKQELDDDEYNELKDKMQEFEDDLKELYT